MIAVRVSKDAHHRPGQEAVGSRLALCCELRRADRGIQIGFISSSLHRSRDGTKVTMYAQWRSLDDYETMRRDPGPVPYLQEALTIAKFEPGVYDVVESFAPPRDEI
jgi:hypothetical protein